MENIDLPPSYGTQDAPKEENVISNYIRNCVLAVMNGRSVRQIDSQEAWNAFVRRIDALSHALQEELPSK